MDGVIYLHSWNIIHRDLKIENIFMTDHVPVIGDFGLATQMKEGTKVQGVVGSVQYMAPEVLLNLPYDYKIDLWSVGMYKTF